MTINKLILSLSVAALVGAVAPALADDATTALNGVDPQTGYAPGAPDNGMDLYVPAGPAFGYMQQPTYMYVPSPIQNFDVIPEPTVPLGDVGTPGDSSDN
jgi:hypothetical protein